MGAGEAVQNAQEYIGKLSDAELIAASPYYKTMLEKGVSPQEARKVVTDKAAEYAAQLQGSVAAFGDVITGKLVTGQFDKLSWILGRGYARVLGRYCQRHRY
jgi:hypothetical protein